MTSVQARSGKAALLAVLCAIALSAPIAASGSRAPPAGPAPLGCGPTPSWIAGAAVSQDGQSALQSCFSHSSSQAEAVLSIANGRPYAQLITVSGTTLDLAESSFHGALEAALSRPLADSSSGIGIPAFLLGPGEAATVAVDRPPPGPARVVYIEPAPSNAFAVAALAWRLEVAAAKRLSLSTGTQSCLAAAVRGSLADPTHPERALRQMHACVDSSGLPRAAEGLLRRLAFHLLRGPAFREVVHRQGTESHPARIAFTVSASNPFLANPAIKLSSTDVGNVPEGQRTVKHLSAAGGVPPYRFYLVPEPGGPAVPGWLKLAADGTLTIEPPAGAPGLSIPVLVVDADGEHSVVVNFA
jgi:hypothetical protein